MHWKLIFLLSLVGLAMAVGTVFFIPSHIEAAVWLGIFVLCAYWIGRYTRRYRFAHGVLVGLASSVWITALHLLFEDRYLAGHPRESGLIRDLHTAHIYVSATTVIAITGPLTGLMFGIVIGVFAMVAALMMAPQPAPAAAS